MLGKKLPSTHRWTTDKLAYAIVVSLAHLQSRPHVSSIAQQPVEVLQLCMLVLL